MEPKEDVQSFNYLVQVYSILWKSKVSLTAGYVVFFLIKKKLNIVNKPFEFNFKPVWIQTVCWQNYASWKPWIEIA